MGLFNRKKKTLEESASDAGIVFNPNARYNHETCTLKAAGKTREEALKRLRQYQIDNNVISFYDIIEDPVHLSTNGSGVRIIAKGYIPNSPNTAA